jgi:superfamily I DNA/RNA helicase
MVQMIPSTYRVGIPNSEQVLFDALRLIENRPNWIVIHSLKQAQSIENLSAETDFVVLVPGHGILLIEAKGATAAKIDGNKWTLAGVPKDAEHKDPLSQLDSAIANIRRYLKKQKLADYNLPITRLVWFTRLEENSVDQAKRDKGMELYPWELAWLEDLEDPESIIKRNLTNYVKEHLSLEGKPFEPEQLTPQRAAEIARALRVDIEVSSDKNSAAKERHVLVHQATKEQLRLLDMVSENPYIYFEGGAGSGKTQLVVEAALNFAKQGKSVLLTTWTVMMAEHLAKRFEGVANVHVEDVGSLLASLTNAERPEDVSKDDWYDRVIAERALDEIKSHPELRSFDAICIDEFQDIATKPEVCKALFALLRDDERIVLAGDDEQQIMATSTKVHAFESARALRSDFAKFALKTNCRQAPELSLAIHEFLGIDASRLNHLIDSGTDNSFEVIATSQETQNKDLARVLSRLLEKFNGKDIRVLSPFGPVNSSLAVLFDQKRTPKVHSKEVQKMMPLLKHETSPNGTIAWRSISKFKGLEQDVIVIMDINNSARDWLEGEGKNLREQLYVGMTRAKFHVVLLVSDELYPSTYSLDGIKL